MYKHLKPKTINNDTKPHKFMNSLFNSKAKFLTIRITKSIGINIDESKKDILLSIVCCYYRDDFDNNHDENDNREIILMFEEFED